MAIVKMKRLRLIGMCGEREELLRQLQQMGCVQIDEPAIDLTDPAWAALCKPEGRDLTAAKERSALLQSALTTLNKYCPAKKALLQSRPVMSESDFFDDGSYDAALETARAIMEAEKTLTGHQSEQGKLQAQKASLAPWLSLDVPLDFTGGENFSAVFGTVPARADLASVEAAVSECTELAQLCYAGEDRELKYFLLVCHKSVESACAEAMRPFGYAQANLRGWSGSAVDNVRMLDNRLEALAKQVEEDEARASSFGDSRQSLLHALDRTDQEIAREEAKGRLIDTEDAFCLDGWFPAEDEGALGAVLGRFTCAWESEVPAEEEFPEVPVKLKNNGFTRPLNMVTDMYSLPAYNGVDPNPLMAFFFIFFYGFMMADMGYGLLMMLISLVVIKKTRPNGATMRHMMPLMGWCGVSTFIMGALTGGFFGDLIPQVVELASGRKIALPSLFSPLDNALEVLVASLVIGALQIFTGMIISMYKQIKRGETLAALCNEGAWFLVFIIAGVGIAIGQIKIALIAALVVLVLTQGYGKKGIIGKLMGIGGSLYNNITGYFSDILSYSRLMALMLAGAVIAQVFNTLGAITGNLIAFFIISIIGNALNFALNLLGCYVHDMRLQCLEFFGRFYEDGGKPFRPLSYSTKYVDINKK